MDYIKIKTANRKTLCVLESDFMMFNSILEIDPNYQAYLNTGAHQGTTFAKVKGKNDRFFLNKKHLKKVKHGFFY